MLLRKCDVRRGAHRPNIESDRYGNDKTQKIKYKFNSLGFRGEEYNPNAKKLIYVGGASITFGTGLRYEDCFVSKFKEILADSNTINEQEINVLNFSVGGASNDLIVRTIMRQSSTLNPDLIVVYFAPNNRTEYVDDENVILMVNPNKSILLLEENHEMASYYAYYTQELGFVNLLKNLLILQFFCKNNNIDLVVVLHDIKLLTSNSFLLNPFCNNFINLIDKDHICNFILEKLDDAEDAKQRKLEGKKGGHPGVLSNKTFAEKVADFYLNRNPKNGRGNKESEKQSLKNNSNGSLLPCDIRTDIHTPCNKMSVYPGDSSGEIDYHFNSIGFRGEEYDVNAKKHIFVFGCEYTFGVGLKYEETWPYQIKKMIAAKERLNLDEINLLNFGVGSQSNDFIGRMILLQCSRVKPDLVVSLFSHNDRAEYISTKKHDFIHMDDFGKKEEATNYYMYYNEAIGLTNMMKNMLLAQYYCSICSIKYIYSGMDMYKMHDKNNNSSSVFDDFVGFIDKNKCVDFTMDKIDFSVSNDCPGPESNRLFAEKLLHCLYD